MISQHWFKKIVWFELLNKLSFEPKKTKTKVAISHHRDCYTKHVFHKNNTLVFHWTIINPLRPRAVKLLTMQEIKCLLPLIPFKDLHGLLQQCCRHIHANSNTCPEVESSFKSLVFSSTSNVPIILKFGLIILKFGMHLSSTTAELHATLQCYEHLNTKISQP